MYLARNSTEFLDYVGFVVRSWPKRPLRITLFLFELAVVLFRIKFCVSRGAVLNLRHLCRGAIVAFLSFVSRGAVLDV